LRECVTRLNRQALHAERLEFTHPRTGERVHFVASIPEDMSDVLSFLRKQKAIMSREQSN
jgi:23S rRNA pseudouridine1911/1915/1917 synthase